jgi:DNA polymerase-3 subunit delta
MTAAELPPLTLISGPEEVLVERELSSLVGRAREAAMEVVRIDAADYEPGALLMHASPSLFGGATFIIVRGLHEAPDELQDDLLSLLGAPAEDVFLLVTHASGQRGKRVLDALKKQRARIVTCPAPGPAVGSRATASARWSRRSGATSASSLRPAPS